MAPREVLLLTSALLLLASCQVGKQEAKQLEGFQQTKDPRIVVQTPVTCTDVSDVCGRLYEEHGGACLDLTESADFATRATMRRCAVNDFRQAIAHLPPASDKLVATRGLAEAILISRDNSSDPAADAAELDSVASQLQDMPGGAAYGAYYAANNDLNRVLTRNVPVTQACATLKGAQARLATSNAPTDLDRRIDDLRKNLAVAMSNRSCS